MADSAADPDLLAAWVRGWSLARGAPAPAAFADGWRVEVGWPEQKRRYVFARLSPTLVRLADEIGEPFVLLKACAAPEALRTALPAHWVVRPPGFLMTCDGPMAPAQAPLPEGVVLDRREEAGVEVVRALGPGGEAAIGRMVMVGTTAVYDRVETQASWRRRGLASAVMRALEAAAAERGATRGALVATAEGRRLYEALGWRLHAVYSTAEIPAS